MSDDIDNIHATMAANRARMHRGSSQNPAQRGYYQQDEYDQGVNDADDSYARPSRGRQVTIPGQDYPRVSRRRLLVPRHEETVSRIPSTAHRIPAVEQDHTAPVPANRTPRYNQTAQRSGQPGLLDSIADALESMRFNPKMKRAKFIGGVAATVAVSYGLFSWGRSLLAPEHHTTTVTYPWGETTMASSNDGSTPDAQGTTQGNPNTNTGNQAENWSPDNNHGWRVYNSKLLDPLNFLNKHVHDVDHIDYGYEFAGYPSGWSNGDCWLYSTQVVVESLMAEDIRAYRPTMGKIGDILYKTFIAAGRLWNGAYQHPQIIDSYVKALAKFNLHAEVIDFADKANTRDNNNLTDMGGPVPTMGQLRKMLALIDTSKRPAIFSSYDHYFPVLCSCDANGNPAGDGSGTHVLMGDSSENGLVGPVRVEWLVSRFTAPRNGAVWNNGFWTGRVVHIVEPDQRFVRV